jgi:hypothetical protein
MLAGGPLPNRDLRLVVQLPAEAMQAGGRPGRCLFFMPESEQDTLDLGKRASDTINLHVIGGNAGKWVALRLSDGGSDGIPYDTRRDAIRHQLHEQLCCYVKVPPDGMPANDAMRFILVNRALYAAGFRLADPDDEREPIYPMNDEEITAVILNAGRKIL